MDTLIEKLSLSGTGSVFDEIKELRSEFIEVGGRVLGFVPVGDEYVCLYEKFTRDPSIAEEDVYDAQLCAIIIQNVVNDVHLSQGKKSNQPLYGPYRHKSNQQIERDIGVRGDSLLLNIEQLDGERTVVYVFDQLEHTGMFRIHPIVLTVTIPKGKSTSTRLGVETRPDIVFPYFEDAKRQGEVIKAFAVVKDLVFLSTLYGGLLAFQLDATQAPRETCGLQWANGFTLEDAIKRQAPSVEESSATEEPSTEKREFALKVIDALEPRFKLLCDVDTYDVEAMSVASESEEGCVWSRLVVGTRSGVFFSILMIPNQENDSSGYTMMLDNYKEFSSPIIRTSIDRSNMRVTGIDFTYFAHIASGYEIESHIPHITDATFVFLSSKAYVVVQQVNGRVCLLTDTGKTVDRDVEYERSGLLENGVFTGIQPEEIRESHLDDMIILFPETINQLQVIVHDSKILQQMIVYDACCVLNTTNRRIQVLYFPPLDEYVLSHRSNTRRLLRSELDVRSRIEIHRKSLVDETKKQNLPQQTAIETSINEEVCVEKRIEPFYSKEYEAMFDDRWSLFWCIHGVSGSSMNIGHIPRANIIAAIATDDPWTSAERVVDQQDATVLVCYGGQHDHWLQTNVEKFSIATISISFKNQQNHFAFIRHPSTAITLGEVELLCPDDPERQTELFVRLSSELGSLAKRETFETRDVFACLPLPNPRVENARAAPAVVEDLLYMFGEMIPRAALKDHAAIWGLHENDMDIILSPGDAPLEEVRNHRRALWFVYLSIYATYQNRIVYVIRLDSTTHLPPDTQVEYLLPSTNEWVPLSQYQPSIREEFQPLHVRASPYHRGVRALPFVYIEPLLIHEIQVRSCTESQPPICLLFHPDTMAFTRLLLIE